MIAERAADLIRLKEQRQQQHEKGSQNLFEYDDDDDDYYDYGSRQSGGYISQRHGFEDTQHNGLQHNSEDHLMRPTNWWTNQSKSD